MSGKFVLRAAVIDSAKSEQAASARRRREGLTCYPVRRYALGCPDSGCGAFRVVDTGRPNPTAAGCRALLAARNRVEKAGRRGGRSWISNSSPCPASGSRTVSSPAATPCSSC